MNILIAAASDLRYNVEGQGWLIVLKAKASWTVPAWSEEDVARLARETGLSLIAARFFVQRGKTTKSAVENFIHIDENAVHDPFLLKGMKEAAERIHRAVSDNERVLVFGDYDADGVTSTSLMYSVLRELGAEAAYYVPNRFTEGYGPNEEAFRQAKDEGVTVIITVDTGISAGAVAEKAKEWGIDLIITDHHEPPPTLPDAYAIINPKQEKCDYPNPALAGVGVAFKLAHALLGEAPDSYYDYVAIGSIADLVPLEGENRYFAQKGLEAMLNTPRLGVQALLDKAGADPSAIDEETVGFLIGPRLNAAGRLDSADPAIALLLSEDPEEAHELAQMVDDLNKERQQIVKEITEEASLQAEEDGLPPVIVVGAPGWNPGVIGIVASRLTEMYYRPAIVLSYDPENGIAKGSARSIEGFDMFASLSECRDYLPHFGGHPMAAGLTMNLKDVGTVHKHLITIAEKTMNPEDWERKLTVDLPVSIDEISVPAIEELGKMAPFGVGNPAPKVMLDNVNVGMMKKIGANEDHMKISFTDNDATKEVDGIAFRFGAVCDEISPLAKVSAVGKLSINEWNGNRKPQLMIEDIKVNEQQLFDYRGGQRLFRDQKLFETDMMTVIQFRKESDEYLSKLPESWEVIRIDDAELPEESAFKLRQSVRILLLDLPETKDQFFAALACCENAERVYASFIYGANRMPASIPSRDQFKSLYAIIRKKEQIDMKQHAEKLADHKGWTLDSLRFMCQVFSELGFVKMDNGVVAVHPEPDKRDLTESKTYRKGVEHSELENELYYSSYRALKRWIDEAMAGQKPVFSHSSS